MVSWLGLGLLVVLVWFSFYSTSDNAFIRHSIAIKINIRAILNLFASMYLSALRLLIFFCLIVRCIPIPDSTITKIASMIIVDKKKSASFRKGRKSLTSGINDISSVIFNSLFFVQFLNGQDALFYP